MDCIVNGSKESEYLYDTRNVGYDCSNFVYPIVSISFDRLVENDISGFTIE